MNKKTNIAVFASGNGSNFEALVQACKNGTIAADIRILVCDQPNAYCIERAKTTMCLFLSKRRVYRQSALRNGNLPYFKTYDIELICLAGYAHCRAHAAASLRR